MSLLLHVFILMVMWTNALIFFLFFSSTTIIICYAITFTHIHGLIGCYIISEIKLYSLILMLLLTLLLLHPKPEVSIVKNS